MIKIEGKWTDELIKEKISECMNALNIDRMPTRSEMEFIFKKSALSNKISKTGGFNKWANKLNLNIKNSETKLGQKYEKIIQEKLINLGYNVELTSTKHPFDLYINNCIKIDVKVANKYTLDNNGYYSFNLEKNPPTCDIYILVCIKNEEIEKLFVIPSFKLNQTQVSISKNSSKNIYIDRYDIIEEYNNMYFKINKLCNPLKKEVIK